MRVFADTSALFAYKYAGDANHEKARRFMSQVKDGELPVKLIYLSDYIFDELMTLLRIATGNVEVAIAFGEELRSSGGFRILRMPDEGLEKAWSIFKKYKDVSRLSFTDCTSVALMQSQGIDQIFAYDAHFKRFTLRVVG